METYICNVGQQIEHADKRKGEKDTSFERLCRISFWPLYFRQDLKFFSTSLEQKEAPG